MYIEDIVSIKDVICSQHLEFCKIWRTQNCYLTQYNSKPQTATEERIIQEPYIKKQTNQDGLRKTAEKAELHTAVEYAKGE